MIPLTTMPLHELREIVMAGPKPVTSNKNEQPYYAWGEYREAAKELARRTENMVSVDALFRRVDLCQSVFRNKACREVLKDEIRSIAKGGTP